MVGEPDEIKIVVKGVEVETILATDFMVACKSKQFDQSFQNKPTLLIISVCNW